MDNIPWTDYSVVGYAASISILSLIVVILTVVYFLAQCSTCMNYRRNRSGCGCYVLLMLICGIALLVLGILFLNDDSTLHSITKLFQKSWENRNTEKYFWKTFQEQFRCCGLHSASDWGANVTNSCCEDATFSCTKDNAYKIGCLDIITETYEKVIVVALAASAFVGAAVSIIGIIFACAMHISCRESN